MCTATLSSMHAVAAQSSMHAVAAQRQTVHQGVALDPFSGGAAVAACRYLFGMRLDYR